MSKVEKNFFPRFCVYVFSFRFKYIHKYIIKKENYKLKMGVNIFRIKKFEAVTFGLGTSQWSRLDKHEGRLPGIELRKKVFFFVSSS